MTKTRDLVPVFLRMALGAAFLSSVAARFGGWGPPGSPNGGWGDFDHFLAYTAQTLSFLPQSAIPTAAWAATVLETALGLALVVGAFTRVAAFLSGVLLLLFALAMTLSFGVKSALDYSVFSASAGAFLLATSGKYIWSIDSLIEAKHHKIARVPAPPS